MSILIELGTYGNGGFDEGAGVAGEELTAGAEEAAVAGDGAKGGGGGHGRCRCR